MWFTKSNQYRSVADAATLARVASHHKWLWFFIFIAVFATQSLSAQSNAEEYSSLKRYQLPQTAIPIEELVETDSRFSIEGQPFSGIAFERYENGQLLRVIHIHKGLQHGPLYLWYPNGAPQMSASYRSGRLHGRFLGWYARGGIIYDMMIGTNGYGGDFLEDDSRNGDDETEDTEREGTDND